MENDQKLPITGVAVPGCLSQSPDPDLHKRIKVFLTQKLILSSQNYNPGCSSRILDLSVLNLGSRGQKSTRPDPQHCQ